MQADCILVAGTIHSGAVQTVTKEQEKLVMKQESKYIKVLRKLKQLQAQFNEAKQTIAIQSKCKAGQVKTVKSIKSAKSD